MVKRYDPILNHDDEEESERMVEIYDGLYVLHADYAALLEAAKLLRDALRRDEETIALNNPIVRALIEEREP